MEKRMNATKNERNLREFVKSDKELAEAVFREVLKKRVEKDVLGMLVMQEEESRAVNAGDNVIAAEVADKYVQSFDETPAYWKTLEDIVKEVKEVKETKK